MEVSKTLRDRVQSDMSSMNEDVRHVSRCLASDEAKLETIDKKLAEFDAHFAAIDRRFAELDARFAAFNKYYEAASDQISELEKETQETRRATQEMRRSTAYINARLEALEMAAMAADLAPRRNSLKMVQVMDKKDTVH